MLFPFDPAWTKLHTDLAALTDAAVEFRYPNNWSGGPEAVAAYNTCRRVRALARRTLGLKV